VCNSILGVDAGAFTGFTYVFQDREKIYDIFEEICGARLTTNIGRIGGFERDFSPRAYALIEAFLKEFPPHMKEFQALFDSNRIFIDRIKGAGPISAERALNYSFTGPNLRAAGVDYDVRIAKPYSGYEDFEFDIPVGTNGDTYDRYVVRNEEIWQSMRIIQQAMDKISKMPAGVFHADIPDFYLPPKQEVYRSMEALIYHFKIVMGETEIPKGEVYHSIEAANGELGFYLVSDGGRSPYRLHFRRPCFIYYQAFPEMVKGAYLSDAVVTMSSLNLIAGEMDA
jgi:NADH-quinone oxidoreductase subunit D